MKAQTGLQSVVYLFLQNYLQGAGLQLVRLGMFKGYLLKIAFIEVDLLELTERHVWKRHGHNGRLVSL